VKAEGVVKDRLAYFRWLLHKVDPQQSLGILPGSGESAWFQIRVQLSIPGPIE